VTEKKNFNPNIYLSGFRCNLTEDSDITIEIKQSCSDE
jgi:hypothetical protein